MSSDCAHSGINVPYTGSGTHFHFHFDPWLAPNSVRWTTLIDLPQRSQFRFRGLSHSNSLEANWASPVRVRGATVHSGRPHLSPSL